MENASFQLNNLNLCRKMKDIKSDCLAKLANCIKLSSLYFLLIKLLNDFRHNLVLAIMLPSPISSICKLT